MSRIYGGRNESIRTVMLATERSWERAAYGKASGIHTKSSKTTPFSAIGLDASSEEARLLLVPLICFIRHWRCFSDFGSMGL